MKCAASLYSEAWPSDTKSVAALAFHIAGKDGHHAGLSASHISQHRTWPSLTLNGRFLASRKAGNIYCYSNGNFLYL